MTKENWKVFINYGTTKEFEATENAEFPTKELAKQFCREHGFPMKCIMRVSEYKNMRRQTQKITIG